MNLKGTVFEGIEINSETMAMYGHMNFHYFCPYSSHTYEEEKSRALRELDFLMNENSIVTAVNIYMNDVPDGYNSNQNNVTRGCYLIWLQLWLRDHKRKYNNVTREVLITIRDFASGKYDKCFRENDLNELQRDIASLFNLY